MNRRTRIKICGITRFEDARDAVLAGADAIGFVLTESPRRVDADEARRIGERLPPAVARVGVFRGRSDAAVAELARRASLTALQFHDDEPRAGAPPVALPWIQRLLPERAAAPVAAQWILVDPGAGDGETFDWKRVRGLAGPAFVAGGLTPGNVGRAIREARPWGVDVSSGVERAPGVKDPESMRAFVEAVRRSDDDDPR